MYSGENENLSDTYCICNFMAIKILIYNTKRSQFPVDTRNACFFLFILTHPNKELSTGRSASHSYQ